MIIKSTHPEVIATMPEGWHLNQTGDVWWVCRVLFAKKGAAMEFITEPVHKAGGGEIVFNDELAEAVQLCEDDYRKRGFAYDKNSTRHDIEIRTGKMNNANVRNIALNLVVDQQALLGGDDPGIVHEFFTGQQYPHTDYDESNDKCKMLYLAASEHGTLTWQQRFYKPKRFGITAAAILYNEQARRGTVRQCKDHELVAGRANTTVHAKPRLPRGLQRVLFRDHVSRHVDTRR